LPPGKWSGGLPLLGYDVDLQGFKLVVNAQEAEQVQAIFALYLECGGLLASHMPGSQPSRHKHYNMLLRNTENFSVSSTSFVRVLDPSPSHKKRRGEQLELIIIQTALSS
jgi:hypothetical protein